MSDHAPAAPKAEELPFTRHALAQALQALGAGVALTDRFGVVADQRPAEPACRAARLKLIQAAAMPEARVALARALGCTYDELTGWVICCDLCRIEGLDPEMAQALAEAGVVGVHDLWLWTRDDRRRGLLLTSLSKQLPARRAELSDCSLKEYGKLAAQVTSQVTTDTSVIVVVKGAGLQKADETLGVFLDGFWPALYSLDPTASLTQRQDILPANYAPTPYDPKPLNLVTEIRCGERRIWIKEPNWDAASIPDGPLATLSKEWHMASYAFVGWIYGLLSDYDTHRRNTDQGQKWDWLRYPATTIWANWLILLHAGLALSWSFGRHAELGQFVNLALALFVLAVLLSVVPTGQTVNRKKKHAEGLPALPGSSNWVLLILVLTFAISPWGYLLWLCVWATLLVAVLRARAFAWPWRQTPNTDDVPDKFYTLKGEEKLDPDTHQAHIYRRDKLGKRRWFTWRVYTSLYRYLIVLGLPISYLGLGLADFLQWTKVLGNFGDALESFLGQVLSSVLGDVVTYAMNPAKANNIRHVVQSDLMVLHDLPGVSSLHVFAHSQGTPITFETLFHHMPPAYIDKLKTYVTIGSVLSYYHQTNPILDPLYMTRFPVPQYRAFPPGFRWLNFWNLVDPITEFYGLDEYALARSAPRLALNDQCYPIPPKPDDTPADYDTASPQNIKTPATLLNHSEYWSNQDQVQRPFAQRVLGDLEPVGWEIHQPRPAGRLSHRWRVGLMFVACLALWVVPLAVLLLAVLPWLSFQGPLALSMVGLFTSMLDPLQKLGGYAQTLLDPWRHVGGAATDWLNAHQPLTTFLNDARTALFSFGNYFALPVPDHSVPVNTFWPVRFLAELTLILLTATVYFGGLGLLNFVYTYLGRGVMGVYHKFRPQSAQPK